VRLPILNLVAGGIQENWAQSFHGGHHAECTFKGILFPSLVFLAAPQDPFLLAFGYT
jgi:hypothetical protein